MYRDMGTHAWIRGHMNRHGDTRKHGIRSGTLGHARNAGTLATTRKYAHEHRDEYRETETHAGMRRHAQGKIKSSMERSLPVENLLPLFVRSNINYMQ